MENMGRDSYIHENDFTLKYYRHLSRKRTSMVFKRIFDVIMSAVLLVLLSPVILVLAVWIKVDSRRTCFSDRSVSHSMAGSFAYSSSEPW